ncbi:hypothetical protein BJY22_007146 [Kribbella shirazensis]|uniref:Uncharacterized protein n=1 Tax=Kribbella shirazensis TaxID=1105143 RepID=A0A7X6A5M2_9ACTN|nr:hypothetical protein [Kribbella shirazensis]
MADCETMAGPYRELGAADRSSRRDSRFSPTPENPGNAHYETRSAPVRPHHPRRPFPARFRRNLRRRTAAAAVLRTAAAWFTERCSPSSGSVASGTPTGQRCFSERVRCDFLLVDRAGGRSHRRRLEIPCRESGDPTATPLLARIPVNECWCGTNLPRPLADGSQSERPREPAVILRMEIDIAVFAHQHNAGCAGGARSHNVLHRPGPHKTRATRSGAA